MCAYGVHVCIHVYMCAYDMCVHVCIYLCAYVYMVKLQFLSWQQEYKNNAIPSDDPILQYQLACMLMYVGMGPYKCKL